MRYFIDTNVFLSIMAHENIESLQESKSFFAEIKRGGISAMTGDIVLAEIVWVLSSYYKFSRQRIAGLLSNIKNMSSISMCNDYDSSIAIELYTRTNVKFVDCLIASIPKAISKEWTVVSYDEDFKKLPVLWKKPADLLSK